MIEQFRSFVFVLVTVVTVFQCAILPADKTDIRQKRDLDFISNGMKDGLESAGTLVNVGQGVIVSKGVEIIDHIMGGGQDDSDDDDSRRKKRNAKPCGKGGGRISGTTPEPSAEEQRRRRRDAISTQEMSNTQTVGLMRKRRAVIDPDNVMPDGGGSEVGNVFKRVIEAAQEVIRKIRTMFTQTSGNPNGTVEYLDDVDDAEMI